MAWNFGQPVNPEWRASHFLGHTVFSSSLLIDCAYEPNRGLPPLMMHLLVNLGEAVKIAYYAE